MLLTAAILVVSMLLKFQNLFDENEILRVRQLEFPIGLAPVVSQVTRA